MRNNSKDMLNSHLNVGYYFCIVWSIIPKIVWAPKRSTCWKAHTNIRQAFSIETEQTGAAVQYPSGQGTARGPTSSTRVPDLERHVETTAPHFPASSLFIHRPDGSGLFK